MNVRYVDRRSNIGVKVERAEKHTRDLESAMQVFKREFPFRPIGQYDSATGQYIYKASIPKQPPIEWSTFVGDAIHNLRSSLDILVWQLILANGGQESRYRYFPIADTAERFKSSVAGKVKGVSQEALKLFKKLEPYKGGKHEGLWTLDLMDIRDKHRLLVPVFAKFEGVSITSLVASDIGRLGMPQAAALIRQMPPWYIRPAYQGPVKNDDTVFTLQDKPDTDPEIYFEIAFGEGEIVQGEPVLPTLTNLLQLVKSVLEPFGNELIHEPFSKAHE